MFMSTVDRASSRFSEHHYSPAHIHRSAMLLTYDNSSTIPVCKYLIDIVCTRGFHERVTREKWNTI